MPVVPTYGGAQVRPRPVPSVRRRAATTPLAEGAGLAAADTVVSGTIAQAGADFSNQGVRMFARQQYERRRQLEEAKQRADQLAVIDADTQLAKHIQESVYDPQKGALTIKGYEALSLPEAVRKGFDARADEIGGALTTPEQQIAFERVRAQRGQALDRTLQDHAGREIETYTQGVLKAAVETNADLAVKHVLQPDLAKSDLQRAIFAIETQGRTLGWDDTVTDTAIADLRSQVHAGSIALLLASPGQAAKARAYFEEAKDDISAAQLPRIAEMVRSGFTEATAEQAASAIWDRHAPKTDTEPISLDRMEADARQQFEADPDTLKATIANLRSRKQGVDDGRSERLSARNTELWGAVLDGRSYNEIRRLPSAVENPDALLKVRDYLQRQKEHEESLASSRESRAAARESRAYTAEVRKDNQLQIDSWGRLQELTEPAKLRTLTKGDILAELPTLGRSNTSRLMNEWEQRTKNDATLRRAQVDTDLFKEVANEAGLDYVYRTQITPPQKANVGKLRSVVDDEVGRRSVAAGRVLSLEEQREAAKSVVDQKVMISDWGYDTPTIAAIVNAEDRTAAYVPLAQIPPAALAEAENYLRGLPAMSPGVRTDRIQRAYALKLIGATRAEMEAVLRGQ